METIVGMISAQSQLWVWAGSDSWYSEIFHSVWCDSHRILGPPTYQPCVHRDELRISVFTPRLSSEHLIKMGALHSLLYLLSLASNLSEAPSGDGDNKLDGCDGS